MNASARSAGLEGCIRTTVLNPSVCLSASSLSQAAGCHAQAAAHSSGDSVVMRWSYSTVPRFSIAYVDLPYRTLIALLHHTYPHIARSVLSSTSAISQSALPLILADARVAHCTCRATVRCQGWPCVCILKLSHRLRLTRGRAYPHFGSLPCRKFDNALNHSSNVRLFSLDSRLCFQEHGSE